MEQKEFPLSLHCQGLSKTAPTCHAFSSESNSRSYQWWPHMESHRQNCLFTLEITSLVFEFFMLEFPTCMVDSRGGWFENERRGCKGCGEVSKAASLSKDSPSGRNCTLLWAEEIGEQSPKALNKFFIWSGTMVPVLGSPSPYHVP